MALSGFDLTNDEYNIRLTCQPATRSTAKEGPPVLKRIGYRLAGQADVVYCYPIVLTLVRLLNKPKCSRYR